MTKKLFIRSILFVVVFSSQGMAVSSSPIGPYKVAEIIGKKTGESSYQQISNMTSCDSYNSTIRKM